MTALTRYAFDWDGHMTPTIDGPYVLFTEAERDKAEAVRELVRLVEYVLKYSSANTILPGGWLEDAQAAVDTALAARGAE